MVIHVVNYGAGNLASVAKGLAAVGAESRVVQDAAGIAGARAIVVPGVGHFGATAALDDTWRAAIRGCVDASVPILGVCLGMQWLFESSEEAPGVDGLGVFPGRCVRLRGDVKVPHVGWNTLDRTPRSSRLLDGVPSGAPAYFTHTYAAPVGAPAVATASHGITFAAVVERGDVFGAQCHPELSGPAGLRLLANFVAVARERSALADRAR